MNRPEGFVHQTLPTNSEDLNKLLATLKEATTDHPLYRVYDILDYFDKWLAQSNELRKQVESIKESILTYTDIGVRTSDSLYNNSIITSVAEIEKAKAEDPEVETLSEALETMDPSKEVVKNLKDGEPIPAPEDITLLSPRDSIMDALIEEGFEPIAIVEKNTPDSGEVFEKLQKAYLEGKVNLDKINELLNPG